MGIKGVLYMKKQSSEILYYSPFKQDSCIWLKFKKVLIIVLYNIHWISLKDIQLPDGNFLY
jgi:hypothetical protein